MIALGVVHIAFRGRGTGLLDSYPYGNSSEKDKEHAESPVGCRGLVSATGQLYGSVNAAQVAEELKKLGHEVDRKIITMRDIKKVGSYVAVVHFHKEVLVEIPVTVVAENAEELKAAKEEAKVEEAPEVVEEAPAEEAPVAEEAAEAAPAEEA